MPINKYELRSKDVQEVMKSPPNYLITWGNSIIIFVLLFSLVIANNFNLPVKVILPGKIQKIDTSLNKHLYSLEISIGTPIPNVVHLNQKVIIKLDNYTSSNLGNLSGVVSNIDQSLNNIKCNIECRNDSLITDAGKRIFVTEGMLGSIQVNTGTISMMKLFINKVLKI